MSYACRSNIFSEQSMCYWQSWGCKWQGYLTFPTTKVPRVLSNVHEVQHQRWYVVRDMSASIVGLSKIWYSCTQIEYIHEYLFYSYSHSQSFFKNIHEYCSIRECTAPDWFDSGAWIYSRIWLWPQVMPLQRRARAFEVFSTFDFFFMFHTLFNIGREMNEWMDYHCAIPPYIFTW